MTTYHLFRTPEGTPVLNRFIDEGGNMVGGIWNATDKPIDWGYGTTPGAIALASVLVGDAMNYHIASRVHEQFAAEVLGWEDPNGFAVTSGGIRHWVMALLGK